LECESNVVPLRERIGGHWCDVVAVSRPHGQQPFRHEPGQRMVNRTARDAELVRQVVQAQLLAGGVPTREDSPAKLSIHLLVEVRPPRCNGHLARPNMSRAARQPADAPRGARLRAADETEHRVDCLFPREALSTDERAPRLELERMSD